MTTTGLPFEREVRLRALADRASQNPLFLSDCQGSLELWREAALEHVRRDDTGTITMWSTPSSYKVTDQVLEINLETWDPGEDPTEDEIRQNVADLATGREAVPELLDLIDRLTAERDALRGLLTAAGNRADEETPVLTEPVRPPSDPPTPVLTEPLRRPSDPPASVLSETVRHPSAQAARPVLSEPGTGSGAVYTAMLGAAVLHATQQTWHAAEHGPHPLGAPAGPGGLRTWRGTLLRLGHHDLWAHAKNAAEQLPPGQDVHEMHHVHVRLRSEPSADDTGSSADRWTLCARTAPGAVPVTLATIHTLEYS
ncbi:hypothetical protein ACWDG9_16220 [Streptomyces sp. NPDC001073]